MGGGRLGQCGRTGGVLVGPRGGGGTVDFADVELDERRVRRPARTPRRRDGGLAGLPAVDGFLHQARRGRLPGGQRRHGHRCQPGLPCLGLRRRRHRTGGGEDRHATPLLGVPALLHRLLAHRTEHAGRPQRARARLLQDDVVQPDLHDRTDGAQPEHQELHQRRAGEPAELAAVRGDLAHRSRADGVRRRHGGISRTPRHRVPTTSGPGT